MKILLVEDDLTMSRNIAGSLKDLNYDVEVVYDGLLAEKFLRKTAFDCVILDVNLPSRNGYEVCRNFRTFNTTTPVILLTAFDELEDKVQGYDAGADDYLTKPFYMKELEMRIQSLTRRSHSGTAVDENQVLTISDLAIDQRKKTVKRAQKELILTPREYQILLKLVKAKGELVTKQELITEIWGKFADTNTNTIEVYINFLRNKVDKPFATQLIKTKIGYGYYLEV